MMFYRAEACRDKLAELNPYVSVQVRTESLTTESSFDFLADYQVHEATLKR